MALSEVGIRIGAALRLAPLCPRRHDVSNSDNSELSLAAICMSDYLQISTAMASRDEAARLATAMVERRLAACVQVAGPVQSTYRWQRTLERAEEWLCLIKTTAERYPEVEAAIRELHTYDCPEIVATPIACGSAEYLAWVAEQASPEPDDSNQRRASSAQSRPEEGDSP